MKRLLVVLVVFIFCCMSCGGDDCPTCPGPPGASGSPPVISPADPFCEPTSAAAGPLPGAINMICDIFFRDQDGDLDRVDIIYPQECRIVSQHSIYVSDQAGVSEEGWIRLNNVQVQTNCPVGTYIHQFEAFDRGGNKSNTLTLEFELL